MALSLSPGSVFLSFLLFLSLSLSFAEIRNTQIRSDVRPIIPFDEFGFTHTGRLELNVSGITISDQNAELSIVGFFLCTGGAWMHVLQQLEDGEITCALLSDLVKPVFTFSNLKKNGDSFSTVFIEIDADQYTLVLEDINNNFSIQLNNNGSNT